MVQAHRTTAANTARGFEIVEPVPGFLRVLFLVALVLLAIPAFFMWIDGGLDDTTALITYVFGTRTLIAAAVVFAVLLWFDRHSSLLYRFERERLMRLYRVGPVTIWRGTWRAAAVVATDVILDRTPPGLRLHCSGRDSSTIRFVGAGADRRNRDRQRVDASAHRTRPARRRHGLVGCRQCRVPVAASGADAGRAHAVRCDRSRRPVALSRHRARARCRRTCDAPQRRQGLDRGRRTLAGRRGRRARTLVAQQRGRRSVVAGGTAPVAAGAIDRPALARVPDSRRSGNSLARCAGTARLDRDRHTPKRERRGAAEALG